MFRFARFIALGVFGILAAYAFTAPLELLNERVDIYRDLEFTATPSGPLQLDLYFPHAAPNPLPVIVVIPGGGFRAQAKEKFAAEAQRLGEAGFAAASIGYRGTPDDTFLATVTDTKAAVRFLRANADQFNINPNYIGAFGQSAGGHLTQLLAVSGDVSELEGDGGNPADSSRIQAAVSFAGVSDFVERLRDGGQQENKRDQKRKTNGAWIGEPFSADSAAWRLASPVNHITSDDPPILLVHGKDDATVPYQQSVLMYDAMKSLQPESQLLLLENCGHGIRTSKTAGDAAWSATIAFFRKHLTPDVNIEGLDEGETLFEPAVPPTHTNVQYGPHRRNLMDVWTIDSPAPAPVLVSIHGGGFRHGQKKVSNRLLRACLDAGIAVVTITYRFSSDAIAPASHQDAARAIQFIRYNAGGWNMDPKRIAATGGSAGAGMSLWLGFHDDMADPDSADPVSRESTRLTCMAVDNGQSSYDPRFIRDLFPGTDTYQSSPLAKLFDVDLKQLDSLSPEKYQLFEAVSAITHVTADDVPALLTYKSEANASIASRSIGIHHPRFGYALKKKMEALGLECQVYAGLEGKDSERAALMMDFLFTHLGVVRD